MTFVLLFALWSLGSSQGQEPGRDDLPKWADEVQTYGMLPMLPQRAAEMHIRVNGVWAGIGTDDPVLPAARSVPAVRWQYGSDAARFVKECHDAGLLVPAIVNGLEGFHALKPKWPNLDPMACRNRDGKPVDFKLEIQTGSARDDAIQRIWSRARIDDLFDAVSQAIWKLDALRKIRLANGLNDAVFWQDPLALPPSAPAKAGQAVAAGAAGRTGRGAPAAVMFPCGKCAAQRHIG